MIESAALNSAIEVQGVMDNIKMLTTVPSEILGQLDRPKLLSEQIVENLQLSFLPSYQFLEELQYLPRHSNLYLKQMQQAAQQSKQLAEQVQRTLRSSNQLSEVMRATAAFQEEQLEVVLSATSSPNQMIEQVASLPDFTSALDTSGQIDHIDTLLRSYRPATDLSKFLQQDFPTTLVEEVDFAGIEQAINAAAVSPPILDAIQTATKMNQFALQAAIASPEFQQAFWASFGVEYEIISATAQVVALQQAFEISTSTGAVVTVDWLTEALSDLIDTVLDQGSQLTDGRSGAIGWLTIQAITSGVISEYGPPTVGVNTTAKQSIALGVLLTLVWFVIERSYKHRTEDVEGVKEET